MQFLETTREVTLSAAGGGSDIARVWMAPVGEPFRDINISVSSLGQVLAALGTDWRVFYGGYWSAGTPYDPTTATHAGGVSQANGNFAGGAEVANVIHTDTDVFPSNLRVVSPHSDGTVTKSGFGGFPIVLRLENQSASPITLVVSFVARTLSIP